MSMTQPDSAPARPGQMPAASFNIQAPEAAGSPQRIAGSDRDDVAGSVAGAQAAAEARYSSHQADTYGQGSHIGAPVTLPTTSSTGSDGGGYYDPPRDY